MDKQLKIIFMGTPDFAVPTLKALIDGEDEVVLVVTQPDRPRGRKREPAPPPVKTVAVDSGIEVVQPEKLSEPGFLKRIRELSPDLVVVAAFGQFLPKEFIDIPPMGCVNVHASILPKYRGAAPANWAILKGEKTTGVTTIFLDEGMDTGDILLTREVSIGDDETAGELVKRLGVIGADLLVETVSGLKAGGITPTPQDHGKKSLAPILKKGDGQIDWSRSPAEIKNHVRGMTPWPGAFTTLEGENIKVFSVDLCNENSKRKEGKAGSVIGIEVDGDIGGIVVAAGDGCVIIRELQAPGRRRMGATEFLRGKGIEVGTVLG